VLLFSTTAYPTFSVFFFFRSVCVYYPVILVFFVQDADGFSMVPFVAYTSSSKVTTEQPIEGLTVQMMVVTETKVYGLEILELETMDKQTT
jgi:hypothetical protein